MACRRWTLLALGLLACQRAPGVYVQFVVAPDVPPLERLHLMVVQGGGLRAAEPQDLTVTGLSFPQNVLLSPSGAADAPVDVIAQGFASGLVQARGQVTAAFGTDAPYQEVTLVLSRLCPDASCAMKPATCQSLNAHCGAADDLAGGFVDCGTCPDGQTCGAGGAHVCGVGTCKPTTGCAATSASCGEVFDGCKLTSCGGCVAPATCTAAHACSCAPTRSCAGLDAGSCVTIDDGCGQMLQCGRCSCTPSCMGKACGADDGCNGKCQQGTCPAGSSCKSGQCLCPGGDSSCNGVCVDLQNDPSNCGTCGTACASGQCAGGRCVCAMPSDNDKGQCCPAGFTFQYSAGEKGPYCYSLQQSPRGIAGAEEQCASMVVPTCVGFGGQQFDSMSVPATAACGSYLLGREGISSATPNAAAVGTFGGMPGAVSELGSQACGPCDGGDSCSCGSCSCMELAHSCTQAFFCVTDPLGPRRAFCVSDDDCPDGTSCSAGACVDDPTPTCCAAGLGCGSAMPAGACIRSGLRAMGHCSG